MDYISDFPQDTIPHVSAEQLRTELLRRRYAELLEQPDVFPSQANWDFITDHALMGIGEGLYRKFLVSAVLPEAERRSPNRIALKEFPRYLRAVPREYAVEVVYDDTVSAPEATRALIEDCELFDARAVAGLVDRGEAPMAAGLLSAFQPAYTLDDLADMRALLRRMRHLPEEGEITDGRGILRRELRYVCPAGHVNASEAEYCTHSGCGLNIYGLTRAQAEAIDAFEARIDALASLLGEE
ncbi:MAG: hypothetical protein K2L76_03660 [Muribaculaceae bacterium]|nr:hypothetical protein [Muribaculaceae bacterium]